MQKFIEIFQERERLKRQAEIEAVKEVAKRREEEREEEKEKNEAIRESIRQAIANLERIGALETFEELNVKVLGRRGTISFGFYGVDEVWHSTSIDKAINLRDAWRRCKENVERINWSSFLGFPPYIRPSRFPLGFIVDIYWEKGSREHTITLVSGRRSSLDYDKNEVVILGGYGGQDSSGCWDATRRSFETSLDLSLNDEMLMNDFGEKLIKAYDDSDFYCPPGIKDDLSYGSM